MKTTLKSFRLTAADLQRIEEIKKQYPESWELTDTDVIQMALQKLCQKVIIDESLHDKS